MNDDGSIIKEFEASHGTVTDMWKAHLRGEETSLNPLSMMEALVGAIQHSVVLAKGPEELTDFSKKLQAAIHSQMTTPGKGTRDLSGPSGLATPDFVKAVRSKLDSLLQNKTSPSTTPASAAVATAPLASSGPSVQDAYKIDEVKMKELFDSIDTDQSGTINFAVSHPCYSSTCFTTVLALTNLPLYLGLQGRTLLPIQSRHHDLFNLL